MNLKTRWVLLIIILILNGCTAEGWDIDNKDQPIHMTFAHTTDTHSKVLPFKYTPTYSDELMGILPCEGNDSLSWCKSCLRSSSTKLTVAGDVPDPNSCSGCRNLVQKEDNLCPQCRQQPYDKNSCYECISVITEAPSCKNYTYGGASRVAWVIDEERKKSTRFAHVDTGDFFQGAPVFNLFRGEAEIRALTAMGCDAAVIGNHEFDQGAPRLAEVLYKFAGFPVLNANYMWESASEIGSTKIGNIVKPYYIKDYDGLRVGYVGLGNLRSLNSLGDSDNSMGVRALDTFQVLNQYVPMVKNQADLVVVLSHMGVEEDIETASKVPGIDIIFGGHDHVVIDPPLEIKNPEGEMTLVVHSGVNFKFVGHIDVIVKKGKVISSDYRITPISSQVDENGKTIGMNPHVATIMEDYSFELDRVQDLERVIGEAIGYMPRKTSGDSPLGNLVADAIRTKRRVETDFAITNTLGIRADIDAGQITVGKMYEVFPFENSVVIMIMSGSELKALFDYAAQRTAEYGCSPQIQISGANTVLNCTLGKAKYLEINGIKIVENYELKAPQAIFTMATNDYIAKGGSGFDMLEQNPAKAYTMLSLRDIVIDYIEEKKLVSAEQDGRIKLINESGSTGGIGGSDDGPL